jgi:hypothetical protein
VNTGVVSVMTGTVVLGTVRGAVERAGRTWGVLDIQPVIVPVVRIRSCVVRCPVVGSPVIGSPVVSSPVVSSRVSCRVGLCCRAVHGLVYGP